MLAAGVASAQTTAPAPSAAPPPASTQAAPPSQSQPSAATPAPSPSTQAGASQSLSPDTIQSAQQALQQNGFYKGGKVDGKMGPKTRHAIRSFQHAKGLQVSGHLNQKTLSALGVSS
jgi:peptidoglycan hydrolase-like protein with peptidoglycan-binding domain